MKLSAAFIAAVAGSELHDIADTINHANTTWTAEAPINRFGSLDDVRRVCGTWTQGHPKYQKVDLPDYQFDENAVFADSIDWRTKSNCTVVSKIRDQSSCGSCWAFGSTETFEDRRCIATGEDIEFSTEDTAGCCKGLTCGMSAGCNGGQPTAALKWFTHEGVVTGEDFFDIGTGKSCKPYELKPCAHHVPPTAKYPACPSSEYSVKCTKTCSESSYSKSYADDKVHEGTATNLNTVTAMVAALQKGPISVAFTVYADFPTYKSGVYKHTSGQALGGHAVEMIGYGTDPTGGDYWLVKNSWNEQWGDNGTFKIVRGSNECGIEGDAASIDF
jgi:cathepsin B